MRTFDPNTRYTIPSEVIPETTRVKDLWLTRPRNVAVDTVSTPEEVDTELQKEFGARFAETIDLLGQFELRLRLLEGAVQAVPGDNGLTFVNAGLS